MRFVDNQAKVHLSYKQGQYHFSLQGQKYHFPTLEKVHEFLFTETKLDTVKLCHQGKKSYVHFTLDEIETFNSKKALRRTLSQESNGAWIEKRDGKKKYFVDNGWLFSSIKKVSKEEYQNRPEEGSTFQKVLGVALGFFAIAPAAVEIARKVPVGTNEVGIGLIALQQRSPLVGIVGYLLIHQIPSVEAAGTQYQVSNTTNSKIQSDLAILGDGTMMFVWDEGNGKDGSGTGIFARIDHISQPFSRTEFQVNNYTAGSQRDARIIALEDNTFVIVWVSDGQDGSNLGVYLQKIGANGTKIGAETRVNTRTSGVQSWPTIASLGSRGFVVTWHSNGQDGDGYGVYLQRFTINVNRIGSETLVNTITTGDQQYPNVEALTNGYLIVYSSSGTVAAQQYDVFDATIGSEFTISGGGSTATTGNCITPIQGDGFGVVWQGNLGRLIGQAFRADRTPIGNSFDITSNGFNQAVTMTQTGEIVVVWSRTVATCSDLFGKKHANFSLSNATEFPVSVFTGCDGQNSVLSISDGGFIVLYTEQSPVNGNNIFAQRFDANRNPIPFKIIASNLTSNSMMGSMSSTALSNTPSNSFSTSFSQSEASSSLSNAPTPSSRFSPTPTLPSTQPTVISNPSGQTPSSPTPLISSISTPSVLTSVPQQTSNSQASSYDEAGCGKDCVSSYASLFGGILGGIASVVTIAGGVFGVYKWRKNRSNTDDDIELQPPQPLAQDVQNLLNGYARAQRYWNVANPLEQALIRSLAEFMQQANPALSQPQANPNYAPLDLSVSSEDIAPQNPPINLERKILGGGQYQYEYEIISVITQREANQLLRQTGYRVHFGGQAQVQKIQLGSGHFGKVSIAQIRGEQRFVAVKEIQGEENIKQSRKEGRYQRELKDGPNILPIYDSIESEGKLYHFIQLAGFGDGKQLKDKIINLDFQLREGIIMKTALGLCNGLLHMHGKNLYHFDLKPDNILFDQVGEVYISDFGLTQRERNGTTSPSYVHLTYASPEVRTQYRNSQNHQPLQPIDAEKQDAWGVGMILVEMLGLFDGNRDEQFETTILETLNQGNPQEGDLEYLILGLLQPDPAHRWTVQNAHDYLTQNVVTIGNEAREAIFDMLARIPDNDLD